MYGLRKNKKRLLSLGCQLGLLALSSQSYGVALQIFSDINYANPAELSMIKKGQLLLGTGVGDLKLHYAGTSFGAAGVANQSTTSILSYGQGALRISPKTVIAMAITQPILGNIMWGPNSFISSTSVNTQVRTVNFAPRISYQATPKLSLGAGLDMEYKYKNQLDFQVPGLGVIQNHSTGFLPGFDVGLFYIVNPKTFVSASFYSWRSGVTRGTSSSGSGLRNDSYSLFTQQPTVVQLHLTRILTEKLLLSGGMYYSNWSSQDSLRLKNTVIGDLLLANNWRNAWSFELGGKYDVTDKYSLIFGSMYDTNFASSAFNSVAYPGSSALTLAAGVQAKLTKQLKGQLTYAHIMFTPDAKFTGAVNQGTMSMNLNVVGGRLTYDF